MSNATSDSIKAPAITRAAAILRLLGKSEHPLPLGQIARELGLVPSTCLYVLRALVAEELVAFEADTKRYSLEAGVLSLARQWLRRNLLPDYAQPFLDRLSRDFDVTMLAVQIVSLDHIVVIAVSQAGGTLRLASEVGSRFPALISATGRCIAAFGNYPEADIRERFDRLRWDDPPSFETWQAQVEETRVQGFGIDDGNYIAGVTVLAAPIRKGRGRPNHALVAIGLGSALKRVGVERVQQALVGAAAAITDQFGGDLGV